ncbi:hypothetical protein [uncultured Aquimarina sp.]|uniref:hypothetical protein n=1 Tax=uncultured Aquimarina sp. TaxID=575652 RepID=UPI00262FBD57|nr:hypothetical protein [uncultured Aquimarina sp.]
MLEGRSVAGIITSLSNNKKLLKSKKLLEKQNLKDTEGKSSLKEASDEELLQIRKK